MKNSNKHFLFAGLFGFAYVAATYTEIYGAPTWFRVFAAIAAITYLIIGLNHLKKE